MKKNEPPDRPEALDTTVRTAVYSEFVKSGRAPDTTTLANIVGCPPPEVETSLHRLADTHVIVLDEGNRVRMAMPFSAVPTPFRVTTEAGSWFANCAWDALGIPAALGRDAQIHTSCADCGEATTIEVRSGTLVDDSGVIHFAIPAAHWWDNIRFT